MQEIPQISGRINAKETIPRPQGSGAAGDGDRRPLEQPEGSESHYLQKSDKETDSGIFNRNWKPGDSGMTVSSARKRLPT